MRKFDDWLSAYIDYNKEVESSDLYKIWCGIFSIAACLQRKCYAQHERRLYPNFYIALVGPPGARKGTAMRPAGGLLRGLSNVRLCPDKITAEALMLEIAASSYTRIDPVTQTEEITSSLSVFSDELAVFMRVGRMGVDTQLVSELNDYFDCPDERHHKTKGSGEAYAPGIWLNILGATTPDLIKTIFPADAIGTGFTSRIIFVYADSSDKIIPWVSKDHMSIEFKDKLVHDLELIYSLEGEFKFTKDFIDIYSDWYIEHRKKPIFEDVRELTHYLQRRPIHLLKLCMVISASEGSSKVMDKYIFDRSLKILKSTEHTMPYVFSNYNEGRLNTLFTRLLGIIEKADEISYGNLLEMFYKEYRKDELDEALTMLQRINKISREEVLHKETGRKIHKIKYIGGKYNDPEGI